MPHQSDHKSKRDALNMKDSRPQQLLCFSIYNYTPILTYTCRPIRYPHLRTKVRTTSPLYCSSTLSSNSVSTNTQTTRFQKTKCLNANFTTHRDVRQAHHADTIESLPPIASECVIYYQTRGLKFNGVRWYILIKAPKFANSLRWIAGQHSKSVSLQQSSLAHKLFPF